MKVAVTKAVQSAGLHSRTYGLSMLEHTYYVAVMNFCVRVFCLSLLAVALFAGSAQAQTTVNGCEIKHHTKCDLTYAAPTCVELRCITAT